MELEEAVCGRRTIRAFRPDPVPRRVLEEIMETALWAPSSGNTQPWKFTIAGGIALESIKTESVPLVLKDVSIRPDISMPTGWIEPQAARRKELAKALFQALGIGREDRKKRQAYYVEMTRCFGSPHIIYLHLERGFNPYALLDSGLILQTVALLAFGRGLGTCILGQSVIYPDVVRKYTGIPSDQVLVIGIGIGYPILDHPANNFTRSRGEPGEFLRWIDVE